MERAAGRRSPARALRLGPGRGYFAAATEAALALAAFRAPYRGRSTPVNAWWGSFDLAVALFSGRPADPPADDFITRNSANAEAVTVGWWPGDPRHPKAAFYAYIYPAPPGFAGASVSLAAARWDEGLGEYVLDWDDVRAAADPRAAMLEFLRSVFRHACRVSGWDPALAASADGRPPRVRSATAARLTGGGLCSGARRDNPKPSWSPHDRAARRYPGGMPRRYLAGTGMQPNAGPGASLSGGAPAWSADITVPGRTVPEEHW